MYRVALRLTVAAILVAILASSPPSLLAQESISRPGPADKPTTVRIAVAILDVDNVNGAAQSFDANVYYEVRWRDERLVRDQPGDRLFKIGEIWTPRIILANEQRAWRTMPEFYEVSPGDVLDRLLDRCNRDGHTIQHRNHFNADADRLSLCSGR